MKINIEIDTLTKNNRIYSTKLIKGFLDNKDILLEDNILDTHTSKIYEELLGDSLVVSPIGYGRVNDNNVMKDYHLVGFSVDMEN